MVSCQGGSAVRGEGMQRRRRQDTVDDSDTVTLLLLAVHLPCTATQPNCGCQPKQQHVRVHLNLNNMLYTFCSERSYHRFLLNAYVTNAFTFNVMLKGVACKT